MSRVTFENYARRVRSGMMPTVAAGRYQSQAEAERRIVPDIVGKLDLQPTDDLLDVGCGTGTILVPLSFLVGSATGVDHPDILAALRERHSGANIECLAGNFLDMEVPREPSYSKILIYSVLHCLSNDDEAIDFVKKAFGMLRPGGRLLVGDIPNTDRKSRFLASETGGAFDARWRRNIADPEPEVVLQDDPNLFAPNDAFVLRLLDAARRWGADAYVLPQPPDLPFGLTREDVLVVTQV